MIRNNQQFEKDSQSSSEDDLALFKQQKRLQIFQSNQITKQPHLNPDTKQNQVPPDSSNNDSQFNKFYGNQAQLIKKQIKQNQKPSLPQINQEELSAKRLRAFNAAKYFQKIKLTFLKQVVTKSKELNSITNQQDPDFNQIQSSFCLFLSILPDQVIRKCMEIKNKNPFTIKDSQILSLLQQTLSNQFLNQYYLLISQNNQNNLSNTNKVITKTQLLFKLSQFLHCKIQKINFFNIQNFVDQSFYNLNFDKNQRRNKKSKKNGTKLQQQIKNKIQRHLYEQELQQKEQFVDLNNFSFDTISKNMTKSEDEIKKEAKATKRKYEKIQEIKKNFTNETFQFFSFQQNKWKLFLSVDNHFQQVQLDWFKQNILNGLPIIAFYSLQILTPQTQYRKLFNLRKMDSILIRDASMYFGDDWKKLAARTKRVGIRPLINKIFRFSNYLKPFDILKPYEEFVQQHTLKQRKQTLVSSQLPKTKTDFNLSTHFLTPSRVGKYHILSPAAQPVQKELEEDEQKIYWKDDLIPVCSRMGWIDFSRMVRNGQSALKKTQNRNKRPIQLYRYEQTSPYELPIDQSGNFILDPQHNSIYVPPDLKIPEKTIIVSQKISYICNKHSFKFAKLVQGFVHSGGMRVLPNQIGFIIYKKDKERILQLHEQRQQILNKKKETRQDEKIQKMWRDLLKYVKLLQRMGPQF